MVIGITDGIDLLRNVFGMTGFMGSLILMQVIIIMATTMLVTRDIGQWGTVSFLSAVGWHSTGMMVINPIILTFTGVLFVINTVSFNTIVKVMNSGTMLLERGLNKGIGKVNKKIVTGIRSRKAFKEENDKIIKNLQKLNKGIDQIDNTNIISRLDKGEIVKDEGDKWGKALQKWQKNRLEVEDQELIKKRNKERREGLNLLRKYEDNEYG